MDYPPMPQYDGAMRAAPPPSSLSAVETVDVVLDESRMYAVEWRDDATFGFTVTPVNSDRGTVLLLARRTARPAQLEASGLSRVVPGDMLIAIGDEKVYHLGAENATKYMRCVRKPVTLTMQLSPYGSSSKNLPDLAPNEYNYLWESGPLGISLTEDLQSKLPVVKRLSDKANDYVRQQVELGDQLIYANDIATCEYSIHDFMQMLRNMPKPILMRFRKPLKDADLVELPELSHDEYEFLWEYGPLGLVVGMSRAGYPFVRSFTGKGTSRQLGLVQENDEITMVNDLSTQEIGFTETMHYLMNVPKPAVLRFRRKPHAAQHTERRATVPAPPPMERTNNNGARAPAVSAALPYRSDTSGSFRSDEQQQDRHSVEKARHSNEHGNTRPMSPTSSQGSLGSLVDLTSLSLNTQQPQAANQPPPPQPGQTWRANPAPAAGNSNNNNYGTAAAGQPYGRRSDNRAPSPLPRRANSNASFNTRGSQNSSFEDTSMLVAEPLPAAEPIAAAPRPQSPQTPPATPAAAPTQSTPANAASPVTRTESNAAEPVFTIDESAFFQVQWTEGPFGSTVREAESNAGSVMLITKRTDKKTCVGLRRIAVGDILVRIGDKDVAEMGFDRATRYLRKVPKPVVLTFQAID